MTRAIYIAETNELQELSKIKQPIVHPLDYEIGSYFHQKASSYWQEYNDHIKSLRTIPCDPSCREVFKDQSEYEEGRDYQVIDCEYQDPPFRAIPVKGMTTNDRKKVDYDEPVKSEQGWLTTKPNFTEECILITASKVRDKWNYNFWLIEKLDNMEEGWYWGILCPDGDEWGDLADLAAEKYLVIRKLTK